MVKRRSMVIGLGALATGSGAVFSSANFNSTADSNADFRVVVDQALVVRAGNAATDENNTRIEGNVSSPGSYLFGDSNSTVLNETDWGTVRSDDGKAAVNGETNENLALAIATPSSDTTFTEILEVTNEGDTDAEVGIDILTYGEDVDTNGGDIPETDVDEAFTFYIDGTDVGPDNSTYASVDIGQTKQVEIDIDMSKITDSDLANASDPQNNGKGDIFSRDGAAVDTVDLVDTIEFTAADLSS